MSQKLTILRIITLTKHCVEGVGTVWSKGWFNQMASTFIHLHLTPVTVAMFLHVSFDDMTTYGRNGAVIASMDKEKVGL